MGYSITEERNGTVSACSLPIKDHLGTIHALVNSSGSIVEQYTYDAWGRVLSIKNGSGTAITKSAIGNRYLFTGREYSYSTGLYYYRARFYDPNTGRFISKDPIGITGGLNEYAYCGDNPVNYKDPSGLKIRIAGTAKQKQQILDILSKFVKSGGNGLSLDSKGYLSREPAENPSDECTIDKDIDKLIASDLEYVIHAESSPSGNQGQFIPYDYDENGGWASYVPGSGGNIYFNPNPTLTYNYTDKHTGASVLAHELLGRALNDYNKVPWGAPGTDTRKASNQKALDSGNRALVNHLGMPARYIY